MEIERIVGIGIIAVILCLILKSHRPEMAALVSVSAVAVLFLAVSPYLKSVLSMFIDLSEQTGIEMQYVIIVVKIIGISYIAQIGADICRDAGETAIGTKVELGGKIVITAYSMPIVYKLLEVVEEVIRLS